MKYLDIYSCFSLKFFVQIRNILVRTTIYVFFISVFYAVFFQHFLNLKPNERRNVFCTIYILSHILINEILLYGRDLLNIPTHPK